MGVPLVVTTVVTSAARLAGYASVGGAVVLSLIAVLILREIVAHGGGPRSALVQRALGIVLVPLSVATVVALVHQIAAVI